MTLSHPAIPGDGGSARLDSAAIWEQILAARRTGDAGVSERSGLAADERLLFDVLLPLALHRGRLAIGQLGQSLDGRIATDSGDSWYINGPSARAHLHRLRALVDAVLVGAGTAEEDRPQLSVRHVSGPDPVPVVLDPRGRVPMQGPLFEREPGAVPVLHLVGAGLDLPPAPQGVERVGLALGPSGACPRQVLDLLASRGLQRVLIEGGGVTVSRFLAADALDYLHLLIAPLIIGSGRPGLQLEPIRRLAEARRPPMRSFALGDELLVELDLGSAAR
ncbi:MAG: RibD family protein [Wenzhouxiangella sp.]